MLRLGCIAIDAAAALEFGALLANEGVATALVSDLQPGTIPRAEAVLALLPEEAGVAEALAACEALLAAGAARILLLTGARFDDPLTGPMGDALLRRLQAGFALAVPGFPSRGRSTYLGHLFLGTALAGGEPSLPRRLAAWADAPVGLIPFAMVEKGTGRIRREMSRLAEAGRRYGLADAVTDAHLGALAEAAASQAFVIGGAGLGLSFPTALRSAGILAAAEPESWPEPRGSWAVIAASDARATLAQIGFARLHGPVLDLSSAAEVTEALDHATALLSEEHPLIISATPEFARDAAAGPALADLASELARRGVGRLLVAGEALFGPVLRQLGTTALRIGPEAAQATPWCVAGETGLQIAFKPDDVGGRDILLRAFLPI
ncbi:Uncharacterized conserved protein YgbK, DUF1537 family [Roseomonas rosea]|uniref:Uncharacterized conserved protein YgbK, DUF1537 family n=1 Tax=Muricoccus roseus TaxID=198092 RepID=A0A1M6KWY0_9PROT|nr:four-carbon acid sugar kinase family protein [Roseomonas rosea]SHJ63382.1 Uncharacterized conserved protein YgbK, DUF1537 family [Roseomonas rosea]